MDLVKGVNSSHPSPEIAGSNNSRYTGGVQYKTGESVRVRVLEHLGGGKLILDLKGQRVVASTNLMLENDQEVDVIVRNFGNRIILQLQSPSQQSIGVEQTAINTPSGDTPAIKLLLGDIMNRLMASLEEASALPVFDDTLKELLQSMRKLLRRIPVNITEVGLPQQTDGKVAPDEVWRAITLLGYDYEAKLAKAIAAKECFPADIKLQLKAELMKLQSAIMRKLPQDTKVASDEIRRSASVQTALLESIDNMLKNIEFQQIKSMPYPDKLQHFYIQLPFLLRDRVNTTELDFFRSRANNDHDDNSFNIILNFDLDRLGHISFFINLTDKAINCQITAGDYETYALAKEHADDLKESLTSLGYNVDGISCIKERPKEPEMESSLHDHFGINIGDVDIVV